MITTVSELELARLLDEAADEYFHALPPEHFMEATDHATPRKITVESFDLIHLARPDIQCFNELLVQYSRGKTKRKFEGVVPDNMVVVWKEPIQAKWHYSMPQQPVGPFLVLEYISKSSRQKDYEDNFLRYRRDLKVPYYLLYEPATQELTVYRLLDGKYIAVEANARGRLEIPELELEAAVHEGWTRFWFRGELLALPGELQTRLTATQKELKAEREAREVLAAEVARLKAELARQAKP